MPFIHVDDLLAPPHNHVQYDSSPLLHIIPLFKKTKINKHYFAVTFDLIPQQRILDVAQSRYQCECVPSHQHQLCKLYCMHFTIVVVRTHASSAAFEKN